MGWIIAILSGIGGVSFFVRGVNILFADDNTCAQIAIDFERIGSRLGNVALNCLPPTSNDALPSWLAGWGAILVGLILAFVALIAAVAAYDR